MKIINTDKITMDILLDNGIKKYKIISENTDNPIIYIYDFDNNISLKIQGFDNIQNFLDWLSLKSLKNDNILDLNKMKENQKDLENIINDDNMKLSDDERERLKKSLDKERKSLSNLEEFYKQQNYNLDLTKLEYGVDFYGLPPNNIIFIKSKIEILNKISEDKTYNELKILNSKYTWTKD